MILYFVLPTSYFVLHIFNRPRLLHIAYCFTILYGCLLAVIRKYVPAGKPVSCSDSLTLVMVNCRSTCPCRLTRRAVEPINEILVSCTVTDERVGLGYM